MSSAALTPPPAPAHHNALVNLTSISINFSRDGLSTIATRMKLVFKHLDLLTTPDSRRNVVTLKLVDLPRIDVKTMELVARSFPNLRELHMECADQLDEGCCLSCYEESASRVMHSPVPDVFLSVERLAVDIWVVPGAFIVLTRSGFSHA